ncbi:MAG: hypothetical protein ACP5OA_02995 [Candidatus Woesearchaeota archaeon]
MKRLLAVFILTVVCLTTSIFANVKPDYLKFVIFTGYYDKNGNAHNEQDSIRITKLNIQSWRNSPFHDYYNVPCFELAIAPNCFTQVESALCDDIPRNASFETPYQFDHKQSLAFTIQYRDLGGRNGILGSTDYIRMEGEKLCKGETKKFVIECYLYYGSSCWPVCSTFQGTGINLTTEENFLPQYHMDFKCQERDDTTANPTFYLTMQEYDPVGPAPFGK